MDIILIPGAWLNGSSWDLVVPYLEAAGHRPQAMTLPGMESKDTDRAGIGAEDQINAVVSAIDNAKGPVLLVGHSMGSGIAHAALDARVDRVARVVHVGGFPGGDGSPLLAGFDAVNGEVSMPDWEEMGEEANVVDFDPESLVRFYANAIPEPEKVLNDPVPLSDERRYQVPVTMVCPEYTAADLRGWVAQGEIPELAKTAEVEYVDIGGGHWPQLTQPENLARVIVTAADQASR